MQPCISSCVWFKLKSYKQIIFCGYLKNHCITKRFNSPIITIRIKQTTKKNKCLHIPQQQISLLTRWKYCKSCHMFWNHITQEKYHTPLEAGGTYATGVGCWYLGNSALPVKWNSKHHHSSWPFIIGWTMAWCLSSGKPLSQTNIDVSLMRLQRKTLYDIT